MSKYKDTIYALSTPTGKSAIAVIRISGDKSLKTLKRILINYLFCAHTLEKFTVCFGVFHFI